MIISGLRTSCAITRREPAERREPVPQRRLLLEARDRVGERAEGARQQPRVLVVPRLAGRRSAARGRRWRRSPSSRRVSAASGRVTVRATRPAQQHADGDGRERRRGAARRAACAAGAAPRRASAARPPAAPRRPRRARRARRRTPRRPARRAAAGAAARRPAARRAERGSVEANTRGPRTTATWLPVSARSRAANVVVEREAERQPPEHVSGGSRADQDRHAPPSRAAGRRPPGSAESPGPASVPRVPSETSVRPLRSATTNTSARTRSR